MENHNNHEHAPNSLEMTWETKSWKERSFSLYLSVSEMNAYFAHRHFQMEGNVGPTLEFWRYLSKEMLKNNIGLDPRDEGRTQRNCKIP